VREEYTIRVVHVGGSTGVQDPGVGGWSPGSTSPVGQRSAVPDPKIGPAATLALGVQRWHGPAALSEGGPGHRASPGRRASFGRQRSHRPGRPAAWSMD
jgi:hypothetical protein